MSRIIFKTILLKGESGNSIQSIVKTGTDGLIDTYTVTLTDGSTSTFNVTNGSNIESVEKTDTSGLVDTYTVTLTDGSTSTFNVTNGNGIESIEKTSTSGLTDTYTITFTNGETYSYDVTNGANVVVDNALSTTSTNPVENKVITTTLNQISSDLSDLSNKVNQTIFERLYLVASKDEHDGLTYTSSVFIPSAVGKNISFVGAYVLDSQGADITQHVSMHINNGIVYATISYASNFNAHGNVIQINGVAIY